MSGPIISESEPEREERHRRCVALPEVASPKRIAMQSVIVEDERDRNEFCPSRKDDMQQIITAKLKLITASDQFAALRTTQLASA